MTKGNAADEQGHVEIDILEIKDLLNMGERGLCKHDKRREIFRLAITEEHSEQKRY